MIDYTKRIEDLKRCFRGIGSQNYFDMSQAAHDAIALAESLSAELDAIRGAGDEEVQEKIRGFADLQENWDSYGASPIKPQVIEIASVMATTPSVVPTTVGGIQFEWHRDGWDIEVEVRISGRIIGDANRKEFADG